MKWLKKNKQKITLAVTVCMVLVFAYFYDGDNSKEPLPALEEPEILTVSEENTADDNSDYDSSAGERASQRNETATEESPNEPTDSEAISEDDEKLVCTLSVRCDTISQNIGLIDEAKRYLIPPDGIIFYNHSASFEEGDSVFDVLLREMKSNKIHFEYVKTPIYDSVYIEGINNIYEFDCGDLSGWLYSVNGVFPKYGCSQYKVENGDIIEVVYSCDMGQDVGKN